MAIRIRMITFSVICRKDSRGDIRLRTDVELPVICLQTKKADVAEYPEVFDHVGLSVNGLPSAGWAAPYLIIRPFLCRTGLCPARQVDLVVSLRGDKRNALVYQVGSMTRQGHRNGAGYCVILVKIRNLRQ
jgi:hypothetical protein